MEFESIDKKISCDRCRHEQMINNCSKYHETDNIQNNQRIPFYPFKQTLHRRNRNIKAKLLVANTSPESIKTSGIITEMITKISHFILMMNENL